MATDDNTRTIKILIDDVVYNLENHENSNIVVYMDGVHAVQVGDSRSDIVFLDNRQCCVFSHLTDLLAYIALAKQDDVLCDGIDHADYIVIKPGQNYSLTYEMLKRYDEIHGFMRISKENRVVNSVLAGLLDMSFVNEDYRFQKDESLVVYCMNKYRALKL